MGFYSDRMIIRSYDIDQSRQLRLSSLLKIQQEIGELHLRAIGLPHDFMVDELGLAFVFTRLNSVIYRRPRMGEEVKASTWCPGVRGLTFYRCYRLEDKEGNILIDSMASVVTVDAKEHKIKRPESIPCFSEFEYRPDIASTCQKPEKIKLPDTFDAEFTRQVMYSDTDFNMHLNNTVYADIICDYMPGGMAGKEIGFFSLSFISEAREGQVLKILAAKRDEGAYFAGECEGRRCFEAFCRFKGSE
ncbi:MAG TPA: hypothetical protein GXX17_01900 [Clostridiales bacterium]|nr:hypothetical protein [Clostridiales bacterium]